MNSLLTTGETISQKEMSATVEKQTAVAPMLSLHARLQQEAEKIRKWKTHTEVELKQKERKLVEAQQTMSTLRKSILELQLQNESLSKRLQEEVSCKDDLLQRIELTRGMCNALKNFAAGVGDRIRQCESEKDEILKLKNEKIRQFEELSACFQNLQIMTVEERKHMIDQLQQEQFEHSEHKQKLNDTERWLESLKIDYSEKENTILVLRGQLEETCIKLESLQLEYTTAVSTLRNEVESIKKECDKVGHEALDRENVLKSQLQKLEDHLCLQSTEISNRQKLFENLLEEKAQLDCDLDLHRVNLKKLCDEKHQLESELSSVKNENMMLCQELEALSDKSKQLTEEKNSLCCQVKGLIEEKSHIEEQKAVDEEEFKNQLTCTKNKMDELMQTISDNENLISTLQMQLENTEQQRLNAVDQISELTTEKELVEADLKAAKKEISHLKKDLEKLTLKHQELDTSSKDELKKLNDKVEIEEAEKATMKEELNKQLASLQVDVQKFTQDISKKDQQLQLCKDQITGFQQKQQYLLEQLDKLTRDKSSVETDLAHTKNELEEARQNAGELSRKLENLESSYSEDVASLNDQLRQEKLDKVDMENEYKLKVSAADLEIEKLKSTVESVKQDKESAEKQIKSMSGQLSVSLEAYKRGLDDILARNKQEFEDTKKKMNDQMELMSKQNAELKDQLENAKRDKESAELQAMTQSVRVNSLIENSKWELESTVSRKNKELEELEKTVSSLQKAAMRHEEDVAKLRSCSQAEYEQCKMHYEQTITQKEKEIEELRKSVTMYKEISRKPTASVLQTPKLPVERLTDERCSKEISRKPTASILQTPKLPDERFAGRVASTPMSVKESSKNPQQSPDKTKCMTPKRRIVRGLTPLSTAKKQKAVAFSVSDVNEESSSDAVAYPTTLKMTSAEKPNRTPNRSSMQKRDGKIYFKASPGEKSNQRPKITKEQAAAMSWFDSDDVFGFHPED